MRILITGAFGQLGQSLKSVRLDHELILTGRPSFDVTEEEIIPRIISHAPQVVIHAAAKTNVDQCELEAQDAYLQNVVGTGKLAEACRQCNATMVYISTDYVFDGRKGAPYVETDSPNPINVYGRTKLAGEQAVQSKLEKFYVVRTSWLYGHGGQSLSIRS